MNHRTTPEKITSLQPHEVFVFGSNLEGIHGKGAAKDALQWGAMKRCGTGLYGQTYAIPTRTVDKYVRGRSKNIAQFKSLFLSEIERYIGRFIEQAKEMPDRTFLVTEVGCGNAGFTPEQIAPMFHGAVHVENICLPLSFWEILTPLYAENYLKQ